MATRKPPAKPTQANPAKKPAAKPRAPKATSVKAVVAKAKIANAQSKQNGRAQNMSGAGQSGQKHSPAETAPPAKTLANILGEIVWLMSQSKSHQDIAMKDLEIRVIPAISRQQFRLFYAKEKLIGAVLWAHVDESVEARLTTGNFVLSPEEWASGNSVWLIDLIAPFGGDQAMLEDLKETVFPSQNVKFRGQNAGKIVIYNL